MAFAKAGFQVEALCPPKHPLARTHAASRTYTYEGLTPQRSLVRALAISKPDLVLPGDDLAVRHLHDLYWRRKSHSEHADTIASVIERSLGLPKSFPMVQSRAAFMEVAQEEGIRVPRSEKVRDPEDAAEWVARVGLPVVLKADGSSGGEGVRVVQSAAEARHAVRRLQAPPLLARAIKHALFDNDRTLIWPSLLRGKPAVIAQSFVAGREATSTVACWQGKVLASLHLEVLRKVRSAGHASVVRLIENSEISSAIEKVARRLGLSGLCGFDFMIEEGSGNAYLIEINPRATQVGHLTLGEGRDLPAAMYSAASGQPIRVAPCVTQDKTIALFPHEWARDPQSEYLKTGYHDVPWDEPELVHACMRRGRKQSAWYSRGPKHGERASVRVPSGSFVGQVASYNEDRSIPRRPLRVMKFGGTSVGDASSIARVVKIIRAATHESSVTVVVSAMAGVTNRLIEAANESKAGNEGTVREIFAQIKTQHEEAVTALIHSGATKQRLESKLRDLFAEGEQLCRVVTLRRELTPQTLDALSGLGERLSAPLVAAVLSETGVSSEAIEATELIVTDSYHGEAEPRFDVTRERCRARLRPLLDAAVVPVVTGFIGASEAGVLTTFGRGGSDYSATILASALDADEVVIWTDVCGLLTADPKLVPGARTIREMSYHEAGELAHFGAKVLHRKTLRPVVERGIPIWIKNTFAAEEPGTRITPDGPLEVGAVTALATMREASLITLDGVAMHGISDVPQRVTTALAAVRVDLLLLTQSLSNHDVCLVVPSSSVERTVGALREEFSQNGKGLYTEQTVCDSPVSMVTLVGRSLESACGTVARVSAALADEHVPVIANAHRAADRTLSFVVPRDDAATTLAAIHRHCQLGDPQPMAHPIKALPSTAAVWRFASEQATAD